MTDRQSNEYPTEGSNPLRSQEGGDYPRNESEAVPSETSTQKYERRKKEAAGVWASGFLSGAPYVPHPRKVRESEMTEEEKEILLAKVAYVVPRGYKYYTENLPKILQRSPSGKYKSCMIAYLVLAVVAFVLTLVAACPVPWYKGKDVTVDGVNYKGVKFTMWKQTGGSLPTISVRDMHNCPVEKQFYQAISASNIIGCVFTFFSIIAAVVKICGVGPYGWTMLFGFLALSWTLCGNAMSASQYHLTRCDSPRFVQIASLDAGFALSLVAWVLQLAGLLILIFVTRLNIGPALKYVRVVDTYYILLLMAALVLAVVGNATTTWKRRFGDENVQVSRVTYWHTEVITGDEISLIYGRAHYRCSAYNKRIKASISFLILGSVSLFLAIVFAIPAFLIRGCRIASLAMAILTWVFLFISWVTSVAVFYRKLCTRSIKGTYYENYPGIPTGVYDGLTQFKGYGLAEGVALVIVSWALCTVGIVLNFAVPWTRPGEVLQ